MAGQVAVGRSPSNSWAYYVWIAALGALALLGFYSFTQQLTQGHQITGLSDAAPWGLYISGFVFFVGASAGATVIGLMIHAFGRQDYAPLGTRAILVGMLSLAAAVLFITVDVGSIPRMINLPWVWRNPTSMFMYTSLTYYLFGLLMLAELYYTIKVTRGTATSGDKKRAKWLAIAAVPFALVVVHAPHGALFAVVKAREFWNNPLLPPHFAVVALVSGTAIMMLVALVTSALNGRQLVRRETLSHMGALLAFFIALAGFLDFFDWIVFSYSGKSVGNEAWKFLTTTHLPFSALHVGGYIVAFLILIFARGRGLGWLAVASVVAIAAVAAYRYNLTTLGVAVPLFGFLPNEEYVPTWSELSLALGIVAAVVLAYSVLVKVLPLEDQASPASRSSPT